MKKVFVVLIICVVAVVLLFPQVGYCDDGGSVIYDALLYDFEKVHSMWINEETKQEGYLVGYRLSVLGIELFDTSQFEAE